MVQATVRHSTTINITKWCEGPTGLGTSLVCGHTETSALGDIVCMRAVGANMTCKDGHHPDDQNPEHRYQCGVPASPHPACQSTAHVPATWSETVVAHRPPFAVHDSDSVPCFHTDSFARPSARSAMADARSCSPMPLKMEKSSAIITLTCSRT